MSVFVLCSVGFLSALCKIDSMVKWKKVRGVNGKLRCEIGTHNTQVARSTQRGLSGVYIYTLASSLHMLWLFMEWVGGTNDSG